MNYLIIILFVLSVWHFVYERIVLPSILKEIRYKIFALRDELRRDYMKINTSITTEEFEHIHSLLNFSIKNISEYDLLTVFNSRQYYDKNPDHLKQVRSKIKLIEDEYSPKTRDIYKKNQKLVNDAFIANLGGWLPYLPLIIIPGIIYYKISGLTEKIDNQIKISSYGESNNLIHGY